MGKTPKAKADDTAQVAEETSAQRCENCGSVERREDGSLYCPQPQDEGGEEYGPVGKSDWCDGWAAQADQMPWDLPSDAEPVDKGIISEMPTLGSTVDFSLDRIPEFEHEFRVALFAAYDYLGKEGEGDPSISIKLSGFRDSVKASITVDLPHKVKLDLGSVETVRENGTFRIVLPQQVALFDEPKK